MSGCKKYLSGAQKRKKKKEDLLMTSAVKCNKINRFFSLTNESDDKLVSNVIKIDHSISKENINNETNIDCIVDGTVDGIVDGILDDTIDINNHYNIPEEVNAISIASVKDTTNIGTIHHADIYDNSFDELTVKDPYFWPNHKRHLTPAMFERTLPNGQICDRLWLLYSPSQGSVFCFMCKLFSKNRENSFVKNGEANTTWLLRENSLNSVNQQICKQISTETQYWIDVLKRVVAVIKYLSSRGLPFRGDNEVFGVKNNGNYLGLLELISEFDPFLKTHIELHDQMAIVLRYCTSHNVQERLLELKPIDSHKGESIFKLLEDFLKNSKLDILNCRGQSYDNAPNMSGTYEGLQAYVKKKCDLAIYVPCTAHSLNLVEVHSVNCCLEAVIFFGFLQSLYNFFSSATHRWNILTTSIEKSDSNRLLVLKSLSDTRWSCHTESCKALINNYTKIIEVLETIISPNSKENEDTKRNAKPLLKKILKKETGYMALLWNDILERSN
ncbi:zinc finger MYM-type protein 1-like [Acyrthosiphon pisum]|uniref:Zinc finger MYM-type protein 1-like n=1 Tax=Acyrthosiphon pisum TaxID=7029 RepID=A0A8R2JWY1_ACYPI|nr:zinc finger MYM-type protein 1-like [Acyrthosiphon pisum]